MTASHTLPSSGHLAKAISFAAAPIFVAQMASMCTALIDTYIAGHTNTIDLAAVGIGSGIYISVMLSFAGIAQGITPIAAHHYGAKRFNELPNTFQQGIWVTLLLGVLGVLMMSMPDWILQISPARSPEVDARTRMYLMIEGLSMPGMLIYRTCGSMLNALGKPKILTVFGFINTFAHLVLAPTLAFGWLGTAALGAVGCAASSAIVGTLLAIVSLVYLSHSKASSPYRLLSNWSAPKPKQIGQILRIGLPIGMSSFVEITSFALIALLVVPLGAEHIGAQRILGNFAGMSYMLPLSISIAALAFVGQAAGANNAALVRKTVGVALLLGIITAISAGLFIWIFDLSLVSAFTQDPSVHVIVLPLVFLILLYQLFDAIQTVGAQALRGLKITAIPMFIHIVSFWGVGMAGGWWLCYKGLGFLNIAPQGLGGFWWGVTFATILASVLFSLLLHRSLRRL